MIIFDSLKDKYPVGAVRTNSPILMKVKLNEELQCNALSMVLRYIDDSMGKKYYFVKEGLSDGYYTYSLSFNISKEGIYFYRFEIETDNGLMFVGRDELNRAMIQDFLPEWQLTVTKHEYKVPEKRKNNITYQIFVDRFNKGKEIPFNKYGVKKGWYDPLTVVDPDGVYRANDFYCGNLKGITDKLDYIKSLGVTTLYLSPIFESQSNHRYDTADYLKIDSLLGDEDDFKELIDEAKKRDIGVMLDGVFNHTGADSVYFNKFNHYESVGAYQSKDSKYYDWYDFTSYPDEYACWWGCTVVPTVTNKTSESYQDLIFNHVLDKWTKFGISGWRLDVVDEIPSFFVDKLRKKVKEVNPEAVIIGEVWEDASTKVSYSVRRPYLLGDELDGTMNYPFKEAIINYVLNGDSLAFWAKVSMIINNYPKDSLDCSLTLLDSHDTYRIINTLSRVDMSGKSKIEMQNYVFTGKEYLDACELLKAAVVLQYTLPGSPTIFYGDEQGITGWADPLSRPTFVINNQDLYEFYKKMGEIYNSTDAFKGSIVPEYIEGLVVFNRENEDKVKILVNTSGVTRYYMLTKNYVDMLTNQKYIAYKLVSVENNKYLVLKEQKG